VGMLKQRGSDTHNTIRCLEEIISGGEGEDDDDLFEGAAGRPVEDPGLEAIE